MRIANSSNLTLAVKKYKQLRRKQLVVRLTVTNNLMLTELPTRVRSYSFKPPSRLTLLPLSKSYRTYIVLETYRFTVYTHTHMQIRKHSHTAILTHGNTAQYSSLHLTSCGFLCRKATSFTLGYISSTFPYGFALPRSKEHILF